MYKHKNNSEMQHEKDEINAAKKKKKKKKKSQQFNNRLYHRTLKSSF